MWLVVVDTTQIQPYIFGSNRLRENVGASYLVDAATGDWAFAAVKQAAPSNNIGPRNRLRNEVGIEHGLDAEVLYAGGGNFTVICNGEDMAKSFTSNLSRQALQEAPGLQLAIAQQEIDWHKDVLHIKLEEVHRMLAKQKRNHTWSAPLLGLSVTASCRSTGLPATDMVEGIHDEPGYLASDEIRAKANVATRHGNIPSEADWRLQGTIKLAAGYEYPADFEDMGATAGEYSHIAIVHADGNDMSQRIREIGAQYATAGQNRAFVFALRQFSIGVKDAATQALNAILGRLTNPKRIIDDEGGKIIRHRHPQKLSIQIKLTKSKDGSYFIPFRPIVFGGDDVTFVCDGRLGLSLATAYLREFEQQTARAHLGKDGGGLTACAGVAIVKSHYPFARAYELAAALTGSAKSYRADEKEKITGSCLDWHFALSGLGGSIAEIRQREYSVSAGSLTLRPVTLEANPKEGERAWPVVLNGINAFQKEDWAGRRNKIKALRDSLREGPAAVKHFVVAFNEGKHLPPVLSAMKDWPSSGWQGSSCGYFDAIELVDWFMPLERGADATPATEPAPSK
jgi:hypothetical protein